MEGALKKKFYDMELKPFDHRKLERFNLNRILNDASGGRTALLPLSDHLFTKKTMLANFGDTKRIAKPGKHFDMLVAYLSGHNLRSMVDHQL